MEKSHLTWENFVVGLFGNQPLILCLEDQTNRGVSESASNREPTGSNLCQVMMRKKRSSGSLECQVVAVVAVASS
jgi:hypothetical protein